ncbi:MAG TPA: hypothetical protein VMT37_12230 [Solirubrobacterales bacterium]|nr:hypothetical protein [Solirubrobacterales bacterium]
MATIICHRGYWIDGADPNSRGAFEQGFGRGFGVETDVRDHCGELVISHDPPRGEQVGLDELLCAYAEHGSPGPLALNVKADGLGAMLAEALAERGVEDWFAFDMSVPDCAAYARDGLPYFTRHSEYEATPSLYEQSAGVWIDLFESEWLDQATLDAHLEAGKRVCVVSPELHRRDPEPAWRAWSSWPAFASDRVSVCSDRPEELRELLPR